MKIISLTFDDGWKSAITAARPLLYRYNLPATFYIISERLHDKFPEYMDKKDLHLLNSDGHEIGVHTRSHKHLPDLSDQEIWNEIVNGREDLKNLGFSPRTFAYPFGEWNPYIVKQVREAGFFAARSIEEGFNNEKSNPFLLRAYAVRIEHTMEKIESWISEFLNSKDKLLILFLHQIEPISILKERKWIYGTTPAVLEDILKLLKKKNIAVLPLEKGLEFININL